MDALKNWFNRNAYGKFSLRLLIAVGSAAVAIALSFLPYDTWFQAVWVIISSLFMGFIALRQRLNESDDDRYKRLFVSRFKFFQEKDPEALNTVFAENVRPRVMDWFYEEYGVDLKSLSKSDALGRVGG